MTFIRKTNLHRYIAGILAGATLMGMAGCQAIRPSQEPDDAQFSGLPNDHPLLLTDESRAFAKALAHFSHAHRHEINQEHGEALKHYRQALQYDPDHADTYLRVALNLIRQDQTDEAIETLRLLTDRRPDDAQPLIWLGAAYRHKRDMESATTAYRQALERAPENAGIYIQLVDLLIQRGDEQEAIDLLVAGTRKADEPVNLYRVLGEMYMRQSGLSADPDLRRAYMDQAIQTFKEALEIDPQETALLNSLGLLYARDGQYENAIETFERLKTLMPDDIAVKERLAESYEMNGRLDDAVRVLEEMAIAQPTNARIFFALGNFYERLGQLENAIWNYQLAARLERPDPAAYLKLAVLQMEDAPDAAVAALREGLEYIPDNPRLLEMLGYVHFNKQEYADALSAFRKAEAEWLRLNQQAMTPNFYLYLALSFYFNNQPDQVADPLWKAMEGSDDAMEAFTHFLFQDDDRERMGQAIPIFEALHVKSPEDATLLIMLAYVHSFRKDYAAAIDVFDRVIALIAGTEDEATILNPRFYFWYAAAHEREGMSERAEELFYKCLELDPDNAEAYNYLAYMWAEKGINLDKAKEYVLIALDQHPDSGAFIDTLGWIYYQQGRYEDAYAEIKRAADIIPDDPTILDHLGDIYLKLDDLEKAKAKWKRSFVIDPDNEELSQKLEEYGIDLEALKAEAEESREETSHDDLETEPPALEEEPARDSVSAQVPENDAPTHSTNQAH